MNMPQKISMAPLMMFNYGVIWTSNYFHWFTSVEGGVSHICGLPLWRRAGWFIKNKNIYKWMLIWGYPHFRTSALFVFFDMFWKPALKCDDLGVPLTIKKIMPTLNQANGDWTKREDLSQKPPWKPVRNHFLGGSSYRIATPQRDTLVNYHQYYTILVLPSISSIYIYIYIYHYLAEIVYQFHYDPSVSNIT